MGLARVVADEQRAVGDASDRLESEELAHRGLRGGGLAVFEPHGAPGVDCHWVRPLGSINAHDLLSMSETCTRGARRLQAAMPPTTAERPPWPRSSPPPTPTGDQPAPPAKPGRFAAASAGTRSSAGMA